MMPFWAQGLIMLNIATYIPLTIIRWLSVVAKFPVWLLEKQGTDLLRMCPACLQRGVLNAGSEAKPGRRSAQPAGIGRKANIHAACVPRTQASVYRCLRCFTEDEGRSLEAGLQEQASNHLKLRGLRIGRSRFVFPSVRCGKRISR